MISDPDVVRIRESYQTECECIWIRILESGFRNFYFHCLMLFFLFFSFVSIMFILIMSVALDFPGTQILSQQFPIPTQRQHLLLYVVIMGLSRESRAKKTKCV